MKVVSPFPADTDHRHYELGASMLGFGTTPQGYEVSGVLEAKKPDGMPLYRDITVELARRSAKTTSIQCVLAGRCESIPKYKVIQTAQDGTRASEVFTEMIDNLEAASDLDEDERTWKAFRSTGREYIKWKNGSMWRVVAPKAGSFRSKAADFIWFDESGELDPDTSGTIEAGAKPTMDTRPDGQLCRSGTPGLARAGTFWKALEAGRAEPSKRGIVDYYATDNEVAGLDPDVFPEDLVARVHPGVISGLTTIGIIRERCEDPNMDFLDFMREYLCVWPPDTSKTAFDVARWEELEVDPVNLPDGVHWGAGYDVAIGASASASGVAWFDDAGDLHVQLMDHRMGAHWMPDDLMRGQQKHPRVPWGYDNIGDNIAVAQALQRKPRFQSRNLYPLSIKDVAAATATLVQHFDQGTLHPAASKSIRAALRSSVWRESNGSRLLGRVHGKDISALMCLVHAIAALSKVQARKKGLDLTPVAV